ncbi:SPOR domain-containing protein [Marinobacter sp. AL4B]|uniref:SPOR domain-containing protein n=1 Tax=Marinobacter sp. AL4B TaxID=2871173 RepID=UPI0021CD26E7|nr:SPOR domain-containing protein [Marinobacter sp. AL4B]
MHWVLVPAQRESDARAQADALREKGDDVYVVAKGQFKNAISLGVFESAEAANKLAAEKKSEKLSVTLAKFPRNRIGYALAFKVEPIRETEVLQAVEAGFDGEFDFVERNACEGVATSEKNP